MPASTTYTVTVHVHRHEGGEHPIDPKLGFRFKARNVDKAMREARERLVKNGKRVRSVSCAPGNVIVVRVDEVPR